ncbi:hypothetical protein ACJX0J_028963, partial [Zea mays]
FILYYMLQNKLPIIVLMQLPQFLHIGPSGMWIGQKNGFMQNTFKIVQSSNYLIREHKQIVMNVIKFEYPNYSPLGKTARMIYLKKKKKRIKGKLPKYQGKKDFCFDATLLFIFKEDD